MKIIFLALLTLIFLLASPASAYVNPIFDSYRSNITKIQNIRPDEIESPNLDNGFLGTLKITNKNGSSFLYPKHSYITGYDKFPKSQKVYISQTFESNCGFNGSTEAIYSIYLPYKYIPLKDKKPTVKYVIKGDEEQIILSGSTQITDLSNNHKLSDPFLIIPYFRIDNEKYIFIKLTLEPLETIYPPTEKESVPITKITVFSLFLFLIILKFIQEKWRLKKQITK